MAAPKGNQFWKARSSHGRKPIFKSSKQLQKACEEYFQWVEDNPLYEQKAFSYQGEIVKTDLYKMRAMTIGGLCLFLDMTQETWGQYRQNKDFSEVITQIEEAIRNQKFVGASADLLNANIIARDLGLKDKTEHSGTVGMTDLSEEELDRKLKQLESQHEQSTKD
jgi:hypothetical protein